MKISTICAHASGDADERRRSHRGLRGGELRRPVADDEASHRFSPTAACMHRRHLAAARPTLRRKASVAVEGQATDLGKDREAACCRGAASSWLGLRPSARYTGERVVADDLSMSAAVLGDDTINRRRVNVAAIGRGPRCRQVRGRWRRR